MRYLLDLLPGMVKSCGTTLSLFAWTLFLSLPLGWGLSLLRISRKKIVEKISWAYCWFFRGTPLVLQLAFVYFGLPWLFPFLAGKRYTLAVIAFVLNYSAYFAEIFRGGIGAINKGQLEAADVLGFSRGQTMIRIIFPQAFKTVLPSLGNEMISLVKDTALVYSIGMAELSRFASQAAARDFRMEPFIGAALIYLVLTFVISQTVAWVEKRFNYYR